MDKKDIDIQLEADVALVLFETLQGKVEASEPVTRYVFDELVAELETKLTEPFDSEYNQLVSSARERLMTRMEKRVE